MDRLKELHDQHWQAFHQKLEEEKAREEAEINTRRKVTPIQLQIETGIDEYIFFDESVWVTLDGSFTKDQLIRIIAEMKDRP